MHVQDALDLINIGNVAYLPGTGGRGMGMPSVSYEQLLLWQPDAILVSEYNMGNNAMSNIYGEIMSGKNFSNLTAVQSGAVYRIPQFPFSWFGKPPSVARLLGCLFLTDTLYPEYSKIDLNAEITEFYSLFYRLELTDLRVDELIKGWEK
jgi:iron complex transport system substrate-binding protein